MFIVPLFVAAKGTLAKQPMRKIINMEIADYSSIHLHHGILCDPKKGLKFSSPR